MKQPEFDKFAKNYDNILQATIPDGLNEEVYFAEYKVALMAEQLKRTPPIRVLDFGCGSGRSLPYLAQYFPKAELWGYDVSLESLKVAQSRVHKARLFSEWKNVNEIQFDAIIAANVFHHIPIDARVPALKQCYESLTEQGHFFLFEHNPYNPATRWIFERCPLDVDAEMLSLRNAQVISKEAGFKREKHGYTMFFPRPLAALRRLEPYLQWLPVGAQYYIQMTK
jgi:SAM-dependent methyltransferase